MEQTLLTQEQLRTAFSACTRPADAARELVEQFGAVDAGAVLFFASPAVAGKPIAAALTQRFPEAPVIGCTSSGEFTERGTATGGVSAVVLPRAVVRRGAAALARLDGGLDQQIAAAVADVEQQLQVSLRDADPERYVGLFLIDGVHGSEERANEMLGNLAPLLSFVGGSAGDDLRFTTTEVFCGDASSEHGAALLVLDVAVPFTVVKTCSFTKAGTSFTVTEADVPNRIVWQLDGRAAAEVYAEAVGSSVDALDSNVFMAHPLGLMIDDQPWIRSPQQVIDRRGVKFYCQILPGMEVDLMRSTDLIGETRSALQRAAAQLGGTVSGSVMFNCILRRLEIDAKGLNDEFVAALGGIPAAGFHTYGESWLGHMNQTLTAVMFGR